jgi:ABC-type sugar transport system substrate-binding protein
MGGRVTLGLVDADNQFQQLLRSDAEAVARRTGLRLDTFFPGDNFNDQTAALRRLFSDAATRPDGLLVMAVRDRGLAGVVREAVAAGVHWIFLNANEDDLDVIRREKPDAVVATVCPDEVATGRIQGQQICALVPAGRRVLYVQGNPRSLTSRQRTAGMQEVLAGSGRNVVLAGGDWSPEHAGRTVRDWLRFAVGGRRPFELVTCQNDHMAEGVLKALAEAAAESGRSEIARIPVTGCDGAPDKGLKMVAEGRLTATVVLPRVAGPAMEIMARLLAAGERPAPLTMHLPASFPPLEALRPTA